MCESNKRKGEREREKERMKMKMKMRKRMNCARGACRGGGGGGARCKKHEGWMTRRETGLTMTTVKMSQSVLVAITMWREIGMNEGEAKAAQKSLRVPFSSFCATIELHKLIQHLYLQIRDSE